MPFDGNGNYTLPHDFSSDRDAGLPDSRIQADRTMDMFDDIDTALEQLLRGTATVSVTDIPSAAPTNIGAVNSPFIRITGTTTITSFGTAAAGTYRTGRFAASLTLTHDATSLILPGSANITTAANDRFAALSLGAGNWIVLWY